MLVTLFVAAVLRGCGPCAPEPCGRFAMLHPGAHETLSTSPYRIVIDSERHVLVLKRGEVVVRTYSVALGKGTTPSPYGCWSINQKDRDWGGGFGTRWLGLNVSWGTYGIHGTNKPHSIGLDASNGCVRMHNSDVEQLYDLVPVGTPVTITGDILSLLRRLEEGNIGSDVALVQLELFRQGYYSGVCDGKFTPQTSRALQLFEWAHMLSVDGAVGPDDYAALGLLHHRFTVEAE